MVRVVYCQVPRAIKVTEISLEKVERIAQGKQVKNFLRVVIVLDNVEEERGWDNVEANQVKEFWELSRGLPVKIS